MEKRKKRESWKNVRKDEEDSVGHGISESSRSFIFPPRLMAGLKGWRRAKQRGWFSRRRLDAAAPVLRHQLLTEVRSMLEICFFFLSLSLSVSSASAPSTLLFSSFNDTLSCSLLYSSCSFVNNFNRAFRLLKKR